MEDSEEEYKDKKERSRFEEDLMDEEEEPEQKNNSKLIKKKRIYSINEKIIIAKEALKTSIHKCSRKYLIDRKCIRLWIKDLNTFENLDKKNSRNNLPDAGRKPSTEDIEDKIVSFIKRNREICIAVNSYEVICEAIRLLQSMANNTYNANMLWFYKFLKRNCFCIRKITHVGKKLKEDVQDQTNAFFKLLFNLRREFSSRVNYHLC